MIKKILHHFFVPHTKNNHRAKLLHHSSLFAVCILLLALTFSFNYVNKKAPSVLGISYSITENDLLRLTNKARVERGLRALKINPQLSDSARRKVVDMFSKNYWAHFAPDGSTSPWYFIKEAGYSYIYAGENLAKGFTSSDDVIIAWMNSPSHRENMLSDKYNDIGFAVAEGRLGDEDTILVVEMLGAASPVVEAEVPKDATNKVGISSESQAQPAYQAAIPTPQTMLDKTVKSEENSGAIYQPKVDGRMTSQVITIALFVFFIAALIIDLAVIEQKKIPRIVGHNIDHIMLISFFILFILIFKAGVIL